MRQLLKTLIHSNTVNELVDIPDLEEVAIALFKSSHQDVCLDNIDVSAAKISLDRVALLFAALALGCPSQSDEPVLLAFLELSTSLLEDYTSEPTFDLALTLLLQHACVLRTGTSNRSRTLISQAVRVAHDLGINRGFHTGDALRASQFYLLLYFADQYV